jgi:hypothetical protein
MAANNPDYNTQELRQVIFVKRDREFAHQIQRAHRCRKPPNMACGYSDYDPGGGSEIQI